MTISIHTQKFNQLLDIIDRALAEPPRDTRTDEQREQDQFNAVMARELSTGSVRL